MDNIGVIFFPEEEEKKNGAENSLGHNGWYVPNLLKINIQIQEAPWNSDRINRTHTHVLKICEIRPTAK